MKKNERNIEAQKYNQQIYELILENLDTRYGESNWEELAHLFKRKGIKSRIGLEYTPEALKSLYYRVRREQEGKRRPLPTRPAEARTEALRASKRDESHPVLKTISGILEMDADPEVKIDLIHKIICR